MPTDVFQLAWAGPIGRGTKGVSAQFMDGSDLVDEIARVLQAGGWRLMEETFPRTILSSYLVFVGVLGDPIPPDERKTAPCVPYFAYGPGCGPGRGGLLVPYDPGRQLPPTCGYYFEYGVTAADTVWNLAAKIDGVTPMSAVLSLPGVERYGYPAFQLIAKLSGTRMNGYCTHGDPPGGRIISGHLWGGGYRLRSQTYNGTYIELLVTAVGPGYNHNAVRLDWAVNSSIDPPDDAFPGQPFWPVAPGQEMSTLTTHEPHTYTIWACPYQMAIWASDVDGDTAGGARTTACLASIPRVPVEHPGYGQAIILPQRDRTGNTFGGNMRTSLTYAPVLQSSGAAIQRATDYGVGIAGLRLPEYPLLTAGGKPLLENPYVWTNYGANRGIMGQLWNCVLVSSHEFPRDSTMQWDKQEYLCMSRQTPYFNRGVGGLWFALPSRKEA